jgi:hypothetical protein
MNYDVEYASVALVDAAICQPVYVVLQALTNRAYVKERPLLPPK